jgi:ABC-2 type transport system ATP-binding protein
MVAARRSGPRWPPEQRRSRSQVTPALITVTPAAKTRARVGSGIADSKARKCRARRQQNRPENRESLSRLMTSWRSGGARWTSGHCGWARRLLSWDNMRMTDWAVDVRDLTKTYLPSPRWMRVLLRSAITSPVTALGGISLAVAPGKICAIVGPNGAGKSTLFRVLTGLTSPTSGAAHVHGIDVSSAPRSVRALIGFVPSGDQTLYLRLSSVDNLLFHGQLTGLSGGALRQRIAEVLEIVGLSDAADRAGFALSAGMRARLQLARALLHQPRVLILDEPTAAVDPVGSHELLQVIEKVAADDGIAVLLSSHRLDEIEALRGRVVLMLRGTIIYDGDLDALMTQNRRRTINLRFTTVGQKQQAERQMALLDELDLVRNPDHGPTELCALTDIAVGRLVSRLDGALEGMLAIEEARVPLRDLILDLLQRVDAHGQAEVNGPADLNGS